MAPVFLSRRRRAACTLKKSSSLILKITNFRYRSPLQRTRRPFRFTSPGVMDPASKNAVYQADNVFKRVNLRSLKDQLEFMSVRAGVDDQYFLAMFLLPDNPAAIKVGKQEYPSPDGKTQMPTVAVSAMLPEGKAIRVYVGP